MGADSENPKTLDYVHEYTIPYAATHGLLFYELKRTMKGQEVTLYQEITKEDSSSIGIPVRMGDTGAPGNRRCTFDFKIMVVERWVKPQIDLKAGATIGLGISLDEFQRMRSSEKPWKTNDYPLIDLRLTRQDCVNIILDAGLPIPPKSSCWFCPYHSQRAWQEMRQDSPELFDKAVALEKLLNERRARLGKDPVFFHRKLKPLAMATTELIQSSLFDEDACESGYCMV